MNAGLSLRACLTGGTRWEKVTWRQCLEAEVRYGPEVIFWWRTGWNIWRPSPLHKVRARYLNDVEQMFWSRAEAQRYCEVCYKMGVQR